MQTPITRVSARSEGGSLAPAPERLSVQSPAAGMAPASARRWAAGWAQLPALPRRRHARRVRHTAATTATPTTVIIDLIAPPPIDHIAQRAAGDIGAQIFAKELDAAMAVLVAGARDVGGDQHPRVGPQARRRQVLEFADINIQHHAP